MDAKKIAIFIDGSNLAAALRAVSYRIDYDRILAYYNTLGAVVNASYFTALPPREEFSPVRGLVDRLSYNGWTAVTKEIKTNITSEGLLRDKGNMDVDIAVRAMELAPHISDLILFSGDGDFRPLVESLQSQTVRVTVVSHFSRDDRCIVADELRRQANAFINLRDMRQHWETDRPPPTAEEIQKRRQKFIDGQ